MALKDEILPHFVGSRLASRKPGTRSAAREQLPPRPGIASRSVELRSLEYSLSRTYNVFMIKFEWDPAKAVSNKKKHGVSFEEAQSVFYDEFAVQFFDEHNSASEHRFLMLGFSDKARLLLVCHCERDAGNVIRIISARKATKNERGYYQGAHP